MRTLIVLSVGLLVFAFALVFLLPRDMPLGHALFRMNNHLLILAQDTAQRTTPSSWLWAKAVTPLLLRPTWFVPMALGLLFGAAALTMAPNDHQPRRRRN